MYNLSGLYHGRIEQLRHEDIARAFGITLQSAKVTANRYIKHGLLIRLKRNIYVLREKWTSIDREQEFLLANIIQVPSYISLMTALAYYEITTQVQRDFIESVAVKRTKGIEDFKVKLGSVVESDIRKYYIENRFNFLRQKLPSLSRAIA